jgi:hypothetical protein
LSFAVDNGHGKIQTRLSTTSSEVTTSSYVRTSLYIDLSIQHLNIEHAAILFYAAHPLMKTKFYIRASQPFFAFCNFHPTVL